MPLPRNHIDLHKLFIVAIILMATSAFIYIYYYSDPNIEESFVPHIFKAHFRPHIRRARMHTSRHYNNILEGYHRLLRKTGLRAIL